MDYRARFYSPRLGRFTQPDNFITDPLNPQSFNRFSYTINNPIKYIDPSGNDYYEPGCDCMVHNDTPGKDPWHEENVNYCYEHPRFCHEPETYIKVDNSKPDLENECLESDDPEGCLIDLSYRHYASLGIDIDAFISGPKGPSNNPLTADQIPKYLRYQTVKNSQDLANFIFLDLLDLDTGQITSYEPGYLAKLKEEYKRAWIEALAAAARRKGENPSPIDFDHAWEVQE